MKRFYKFLMPLVAIVAMALPWNARAQEIVTIGDGTSTSYYVPFNSLYGYSFSEWVYPAASIDMAGNITKISFHLGTSNSTAQTNNYTVWMKNVTRSSFSSVSDIEPVTTSDVVFNGTWTIPANYTGWVELELDTPFAYDGSSNLMIAVHEYTSGYSSRYFTYTSVTGCGVQLYSDSSNPDPYNPSSYSGSSTTRAYMPNIQIEITSGDVTCYNVKNLTATDITPSGCTLTWLDTNNYGATYIVYDMADTTVLGVTYDTSFVLTELTSNTPYDIAVRVDCGSGDSSNFRRCTFRTACSYIDSLPVTEDFESYGTGSTAFPTCWYRMGSTADRPYVNSGTSYGHNNTYGLYFFASAGGYCYGIMPPLDPDLDITTLQVHFWARQYGTSYNCDFVVGVMTDPTDATTFEAIDTVHPAGLTYEDYEIPFVNYTGTGTYIAFSAIQHPGTSTDIYMMLDDVTLEPIPSCPQPNHPTTVASGDTIVFHWNERVSGQNYEVVYGAPGFNPDNESPISVSGDSLLVDGLTMGDAYDFYVRTDCGSEYSQWVGPVTAVVGLVEYNMTVTGTNTLTGCAFSIYDDGGPTGQYSANCQSTLYVYPSDDQHVISVSGTSYTEGTWDYLRIYEGIGTTGNIIFDDYGVSSTQTFGPYISESGPITIVFHSDGSVYYDGFEINTICVPAPACQLPSNVMVNNVTNHEATISWDDNSNYNSMNVYWGTGTTIASATDSAVVSGDNSYTITGLTANTTYHAWIKASCSDGDSRVVEVTFTTDINCYPVTGLSVTPGPVSAMATWTQSRSEWTDLTVEYKEASDTAWISGTTSNNYFPMTGLTPATEYNFRIIATCVEGTSVAATANFRTTNFGCLVADSTTVVQDTIGNGTGTSSYFPSYSFYNYSLTQQIYLASDFSGVSGGQIEHIGIQMSAVPVARNIEIYMTNTSATDVSSAFIPIASSDLVWSGSTTGNIEAGWNDITLTTPFNYAGGNILVTFRDMTGSYSSGNYGMVTTATSGISRYVYQDGDPYSVTNPPSDGSTASNNRLNMYFLGGSCLTPSTCAAPIVVANAAGTTAIELNWVPGASETSWLIYQRLLGDTVYTLMDTVNTTTYTATGLNPGLDYEFQVVAVCENNDVAGYATAATECAPVAVPYTEDFQNSDYGVYSRNCWTIGSTELGTSYPYPYVISLTGDETNKLCLIYNGGYMIMPEMDAQLNTLQARFTLVQGGDDVRLIIGLMTDPTAPIQNIIPLDTLIRSELDTSSATVNITFPFDMLADSVTGHIAFWDAFNDNYNFIDNLVIEPIPACVAVTGVSASNVTSTDATISWESAGATATGYLVEYGPRNFTPGTGTIVNATTNSITLTGLAHSSDYDVYVYTVCAGLSDTSINSNRARFTTSCDVATLPYFENFDNCADPGTTRSPLPNCWNYTMLSTGTYAGSSYTPAVYYTTTANYTSSGSYCLYLYGTALTVLPEMPTTVDSLYISFHHYTSTPSSYRLIIGAVDSITPGFDSSFVAIDTLTFRSNENNVLRFLSTYTGTGRYIAFKNYYNNNTYDYSYHYIDDLEVGYMPSCVWPVDVHATGLTTTTAEFEWSICQASDYEYEYGPAGFTRGTGTTGTWNSAPYGISGLTLGTQYDIYIRGICGAGDTSEWSSVYTFGTLNADPATVPYFCDFTDTTLTNSGWEVVNGTQNNKWYVGSAESHGTPRALYISNDNGASNSYTISSISITYAYRDVIVADGQYTLSYDWKAYGEGNYDYIRAWLVPASQIPVAGYLPDGTTATYTFNSTGVAPAGWISIDGGTKLNLQSSWQSYEEELTLTAGTYHLLFMWANDGSGGTTPPAAIDNVMLALNVCPISDITLVSAGSSSMQISWTGSSDSYELEYGPAGFTRGTGVTMTTTATTANLTGLTGLTNYDIYLRGFCNVSDTSRWYRATFSTEICENATVALNYDPSATATTTTYGPIGYSLYNYSYVQTIIDSADLASLGGDITAFEFNVGAFLSGSSTMFNNMTVYMANVSESNLSSNFIFPDATHVFKKVIDSASFNYTESGWQIHPLDSAFTWDGHSNLLVAVKRDNGSYSGSQTFVAHTASSVKMRYAYQDSGPIDISTGTASSTGSSSTVGDIKLLSCGAGICYAPDIDTAIVGETEVTLNWHGRATNYEAAAVAGSWVEPGSGTPVTGFTTTLTGLTPGTPYAVGVRSVCDSNVYSDWYVINITTIEHPCNAPTSVTVPAATIDYTSAVINWTPAEADQNDFEVRLIHSADTAYFEATGTSYTATGLIYNTAYTVAVRAICGANNYSDWSDAASFRTAACTVVSGVTVNNVTSNSATVTWSGNAGSYEVAYGLPGTSTDDCESVTTTSTTATLTGLTDITTYVVYVRSVCGEGVYSDWSTGVQFTTEMEDPNVHYYDITVTVNDPAMGTATGSGRYAENSQVEIRATSNTGYHFVKWQDNVTDSVRTITVTANATYTATFAANGTQGIEDVEGAAISLYPNPASSTVTLSGIEGAAKVTVVDMNGREVYKTQTLGNSATQSLTIDVSGMAQGAYFVRITGERVNAIRKLIVR